MNEEYKTIKRKGNLDRRTLVKNGAALVGAGLLGSYANSSEGPGGPITNNVFNIRDFGATGKRDDKATMQVRAAVDTCAAAGGGTVYVPPGVYSVGTI